MFDDDGAGATDRLLDPPPPSLRVGCSMAQVVLFGTSPDALASTTTDVSTDSYTAKVWRGAS